MEVFIHEVKLKGEDEFVKKFNAVSDLFGKAMDESLPEHEQREWFEKFVEAKIRLEMGYCYLYFRLCSTNLNR